MSGPAWKFRCPVCGHWCVPADGYGFVCSKRGGCGSEWRDADLDAALPDDQFALLEAGRNAVVTIDFSEQHRPIGGQFS